MTEHVVRVELEQSSCIRVMELYLYNSKSSTKNSFTLLNEASMCYYTHLPHRQLLLAQTFSTAISLWRYTLFSKKSPITSSRTLYWRANSGLLMIWSTDHRLALSTLLVVAYYPDYCTLSNYYVYQQTQGCGVLLFLPAFACSSPIFASWF